MAEINPDDLPTPTQVLEMLAVALELGVGNPHAPFVKGWIVDRIEVDRSGLTRAVLTIRHASGVEHRYWLDLQ